MIYYTTTTTTTTTTPATPTTPTTTTTPTTPTTTTNNNRIGGERAGVQGDQPTLQRVKGTRKRTQTKIIQITINNHKNKQTVY